MFHDSHELDSVIAQISDPRENIPGELLVLPNTSFGGRDSDVRLVDANVVWLGRARVLKLVQVCSRRVPESRVVDWGHVEILGDAPNPGRQSFNSLARWKDHRNLDAYQ